MRERTPELPDDRRHWSLATPLVQAVDAPSLPPQSVCGRRAERKVAQLARPPAYQSPAITRVAAKQRGRSDCPDL